MGTNGTPVISPGLKREDYVCAAYDSLFSKWKILIGPNDWENHSRNKDGAEKYRTQNLPNCSSCSGLYELGIVVSGKFIPVYLGHTENVRTRLQQYGRDGSHLEVHGLLTEVFSRGYSLAYRWAPMKDKREAEEIEKACLYIFDYAWNSGSNGERRVPDILQKRDTGLRLKSPLLLENAPSFNANPESDYTPSRIIKFGRSRPPLVSIGIGVEEDTGNMCGVALGQGSVCERQPVEGRKRCTEHKGMRVGSSAAKLITEGKSHEVHTGMGPKLDGHQDQKFNYGKFKLLPDAGKKLVIEDLSPICGFILVDGTPCTRTPVHRRERCEEHKGKRIQSSVSKSISEEEEQYVHGPILKTRTHLNDYKGINLQRSGVSKDCGLICGVDIENGRFCTRQPVVGRQRCEEHKGMRVKEQKSKQTTSRTMPRTTTVIEDSSSTCGVTTLDGSSCSRKPSKGSKLCWQHEGTRVDRSSRNESTYNSSSSGSSLYRSSGSEGFQSTCGAMTLNDSACKRPAAQGRSRCFQHEGMKADWSSRNDEPTYNSSSSASSLYRSSGSEGFQSTCGAMTLNGSACKRSPAQGRSRCFQHEGMRADWSSRNDEPTYNSYSSRSVSYYGFQSTCGAMTRNGSACKRSPAPGSSRCWQH